MKNFTNPLRFILIFLSTVALSQSIAAQSAEDRIMEADQLVAEGKIKKGIKVLDELIAAEPTYFEAFVFKSQCLVELEEYQEALNALNEGIALNPDEAWLYNHRGILFQAFNMMDDAFNDYATGLEYAKNDTVRNALWLNQAVAKSSLRDFEGAYEVLQKCYAHDSMDLATLNNLATVCDEIGKPELTEYYLLKIIKVDSLFIGGYVNLGFMYQTRDEYEKSITYFDKALEITPEEPFSYSNRSYSKLMIGDLDGALKDVNKSLELYPGNSYAYRNRALIYLEMGKKKKACDDIQTALDWDFTQRYGREVIELQRKHCK